MNKLISVIQVLVLSFLMCGIFNYAHADIPASERQALIDLYNYTNGSNWDNNSGWLGAPGTEESWYGVTCSGDHVFEINLEENNLTGTLPISIGNFAYLQFLNLGGNLITGIIPPQIGLLTNLWDLRLGVHLSIYPIPYARDPNLPNNQFMGPIPPEIGNLINLRQLILNDNQLSGTIPVELGHLNNLENLNLVNNNLTGTIPSELSSIAGLRGLFLWGNQLTGPIPNWLGNLSNLRYLSLGNNQFSGTIPPELGNLTNLNGLNLYNNQLAGPIPSELGDLINLRFLWLGNNQLSGSIPPELGNLVNLGDDLFPGALFGLELYGNQLTGTIPPELGNLTNSRVLSLAYNQLSGPIPISFGNLTKIMILNLWDNNITGTIPSEFGNMTSLQTLVLNNNLLEGSIPPELGNLTQLTVLGLNSNNLTGSIPSELRNLINLQTIDLSNNQLSGSIPSEFVNLTNLNYLWLTSNQLEGAIPPELGNITSLQALYLGDNRLEGSIPESFGNLTDLRVLGLWANKLGGEIPGSLINLTKLGNLTPYLQGLRDDGYIMSTLLYWNAFYTSDPALENYLVSEHELGDYRGTQTLAPTNFSVETIGADSIELTWTPILYSFDAGGYEIYMSDGGYYSLVHTTLDKNVSSYIVSGLSPGYNYTFKLRTVTYNNENNQNTVYSEYTDEVVTMKNNPPVLSPIGNKTCLEGELCEFVISATDPDASDVLTFSAANLPSGATFDPSTATFSWTPGYDQQGIYENVEFSVTDNGNPIELDAELIVITVGNVNRQPFINPIGIQNINEGELLEFTVTATDPDNDNVVISAADLPTGANFEITTKVFSWTPNYLQNGTYTVTFTATDDGDPSESNSIGVPITVGNTENPVELNEELIEDIENMELPQEVENSYMANLKKITKFVEKGQIEPAINQLFAFICKVEKDKTNGEIDSETADDYIFRANEIIEDLGGNPADNDKCIL